MVSSRHSPWLGNCPWYTRGAPAVRPVPRDPAFLARAGPSEGRSLKVRNTNECQSSREKLPIFLRLRSWSCPAPACLKIVVLIFRDFSVLTINSFYVSWLELAYVLCYPGEEMKLTFNSLHWYPLKLSIIDSHTVILKHRCVTWSVGHSSILSFNKFHLMAQYVSSTVPDIATSCSNYTTACIKFSYSQLRNLKFRGGSVICLKVRGESEP